MAKRSEKGALLNRAPVVERALRMHQPELSVLAFQRNGERQLAATPGRQALIGCLIQASRPVTAHPPMLVSVAVILSTGDKHELMVTHHAVYPVCAIARQLTWPVQRQLSWPVDLIGSYTAERRSRCVGQTYY